MASGVDDQIDSSWKQRLANSNLSGPTRATSGRLPLKVADGSIIRNKAFDGDGAESLARSGDEKTIKILGMIPENRLMETFPNL